MKQNKKLILIAAILMVLAVAVVSVISFLPRTLDYTFPPFTSQYEDKKNYDSQDANIVFDGVLDEDIWQNRRWLEVDHVSEEYIGVKMTTYFGEDGLYMAFDVNDYGVYYDKYRYIDYNSGLQVYLSPLSGAKDITDRGYEISLNAGEMVGVKQFDGNRFEDYLGRVYMESQIKGEMNSPKATGYTIEAYIDYALLGENCKEVFAYPAIVHTTSATESERQWYSFGLNERGVSWTRADTWWSFDQQGLMGHEVSFQTGENGTVEGAAFVPNGNDYTFTLAPQTGYYAQSVQVNGKDAASQLYYFQGKTLCTVERVEEKLDIQVTYVPVPEEKKEISGTVKDTAGNALNAQVWAVGGGYSQVLTADAQGNFSGSVPAIQGLELFAAAEGYVSEEKAVQAGKNNISLAKMYFGNNEKVVRSSTNMALWDLTRMYQDRVRMISTEYAQQLVHSEVYGKNVYASAKLFTDVEQGADTRAGFTFYVNEALSVYVALTMHGEVNEFNPNGELSCSVQLIAEQNGERIWGNGGILVPVENPQKIMKLAETQGVPFAVHYNKGAFDVWVDGQQVGYGIYPKNEKGDNRMPSNASVAVGLETWSSRAIFEELQLDGNYGIERKLSAPGWDLSKITSGIAVCQAQTGGTAMLSEDYRNQLSISANIPLTFREDKDIRAGFVLANSQGTEVFVALTANGEKNQNNPNGSLHYSLQIISGGWASWAVEGTIADISNWEELKELAKNGGIPMTVYAEDGKLTVGINGYLVAENIVPLDAKGKPVLGGNRALIPGLSVADTSLTFTAVTVDSQMPDLKNPVERLWDVDNGTYTSLTDSAWASLWLSESYTDKVTVSANLPLKLREGDDIRAGVVLRNEQGVEVFVALTAHGKTHYSVQVISGGWASWAIEGQIEDLSTWKELGEMDSIPLTVYLEKGKLTLGVNGYVIADNIVSLDKEGKPVFGNDTKVIPGLATAGTALTFTEVEKTNEKPALKLPMERTWDISKAGEGTYTSLTDSAWASLWLSESYTDKVAVSAKLPLKLVAEDDIRAGVVLRNEQGVEVFVALTAHGKTHYSVQVISGGWASWAIEGQIEDLSTWKEFGEMDSIPLTVYLEKGKLTLGVNGYVIADNIVSLDKEGKPVFGNDTKVIPGLATAGTALTFTEVEKTNEKPALKLPVERTWDISKAGEGTYTSLTDSAWASLWLSESYTDKVAVSAKLPLKLVAEDDIRAGVVLRNEQGEEVFVALTAHGKTHYSVQVISGGWVSWAVEGQIEDLSTWTELTEMDSIPLTVYAENGKLTLGVNGYVIAESIVPLDKEGNPTFSSDAKVKPGLATAGISLSFTEVAVGSDKPVLKNPEERFWDLSKANENTYVSLTDGPWNCLWLSESYTDKVAVSANLPLKLREGDDIRAGVVLRNEQGIEVFVALTAHGKSHYSVQVISGGWASWAVEGQITDLSTWSDLTYLDSIPLTVYMENGKLTLGINGYVIADEIVALNAVGNPTFGSNAKVKPGLATAGTALPFTKVTTGTEKPALKQKLCADKGGTIVIPGDFTAAKYAVLEMNIKALNPITYDWNSNILISPTGAVWDAYDFQILYGTSAQQNLIKLTGPGASVDGLSVPQEQWVNDPNMEKLFSHEGMLVKLVRMDTWAYLLVDMGSGYTIVGKMVIPTGEATSFSLWNHSTAIEVTDYKVMTGQAAAFATINGLALTLDSNGMVFPVSGDSWTLEGRLVIDTATFPWGTGEYRMYVGADSWGQAISVYYNRANWYLQNHTNWANTQLTDEQWWKLSAESGGMWVRFQKSGNTLTVFVSADGENWTSYLSHTSVTAKGIYLLATLTSQLRDVRLTADS